MVEYYTVLAVKDQPDKYAIWFSTQNKVDDREYLLIIVLIQNKQIGKEKVLIILM
jgi:hypothetical protein